MSDAPDQNVVVPNVPDPNAAVLGAPSGAPDLQGLSNEQLLALYQQSLQGADAAQPSVVAPGAPVADGFPSADQTLPPLTVTAPAPAGVPIPDAAASGVATANAIMEHAHQQADAVSQARHSRMMDALRSYANTGLTPAQQAAKMVTDDMSGGQRFLVGMGRAPVAAWQSLKQLGMHAGAGLGLVDPANVRRYDQDVADEANLYDAGVGSTGAGKLGNFAGNAMMAYTPGGAVRGLGIVGESAARSLPGLMGRAAGIGAAESLATNPATDPDASFVGQKLQQAGVGALTGGALAGAGRALGRTAEELKSQNLPFRVAAGKLHPGAPLSPADLAFSRESDALSARTGIPFTPGQATGSRGLTTLEQAVRQSSRTADRAFAVDSQGAGALDNYIGKIMDGISSTDRSPSETGDMVRNALRSRVQKLTDQRGQIAAQQYGAIRQLVGGKPLIQPDHLRSALADVSSEYGSIATPGARALTRFANKTSDSELGDVNNLMKLRSYLSKVAGGQARISGEPVDRKVAAGMLGAIDDDLDASADKLGGHVGEMLRAANQNYRNFSNAIDYVKQSPLGKLLGKDVADTLVGGQYNTVAPEKIIDKLRTMKPSEVAVTRNLLQDENPDTWAAVRRQLIGDALDKARSTAPLAGAKTLPMQPGAFSRAMGATTPQGRAWLSQVFPKGELGQLHDAFQAAQRLGDKFGYNGSGTAAQLEAQNMLNVPTTAAGVASKLAKGAAARMFGNRLATAMESPDGRKMLLELQKLPRWSPRVNALASQLGAITAGDVETTEATKGYQDRLRSAKNEWDSTLREAHDQLGPNANIPGDVIQAVTKQISERYGVKPDSILGTPDAP